MKILLYFGSYLSRNIENSKGLTYFQAALCVLVTLLHITLLTYFESHNNMCVCMCVRVAVLCN